MKKTVIALFASLALVFGTGAMGSSAVAAPPYSNSVKTFTFITRTASVTEGNQFYTSVIVFAGNAVVDTGTVTVIFGGVKYSAPVNGGVAAFTLTAPQVNKTKSKTIKAYYKRVVGTVFKSSSTSKSIRVKNS